MIKNVIIFCYNEYRFIEIFYKILNFLEISPISYLQSYTVNTLGPQKRNEIGGTTSV